MRYKSCSVLQICPPRRLQGYKEALAETCRNLELSGTILLASEGINGTAAGVMLELML